MSSGSAYVFRLDDNGTSADPADDMWLQEAELTASGAAADDQFGFSVSMSDRWAVVGARLDDDAGNDSGAAYAFHLDDNGTPLDPTDDVWSQVAKLTASDAAQGDEFGYSVAMDGNRTFVGARFNDEAGNMAGAAYIFRLEDGGTPADASDDFWIQETKLTAADATSGDAFGFAMAVTGKWAVVGAPFADAPNVPGAGTAYMFRLDDNETPADSTDDLWVEAGKLITPSAATSSQFGFSVSTSGTRTIVAALHGEGATAGSGSAHVFRRNDNGTPIDLTDDVWLYESKLSASDGAAGAAFGYSVAIDGDRSVVGALLGDASGVTFSGAAYVFQRDDHGTPSNPADDFWAEESKLTASDAASGDFFGGSVSIEGGRVAVGALADAPVGRGSEGGTGAAYMLVVSQDCNNNGVPDACDIAAGISPDGDGNGVPDECEAVVAVPEGILLPTSTIVQRSYPNPFRGTIHLDFSIPVAALVTLSLYNTRGERVATILQEHRTPGKHAIDFDASQLAGGVYFSRLEAGASVHVLKVIVVR